MMENMKIVNVCLEVSVVHIRACDLLTFFFVLDFITTAASIGSFV